MSVMTDELNKALSNLEAIKSGEDPTQSSEAAAASVSTADAVNTAASAPVSTGNNALDAARRVVNEAFVENDWLSDHLSVDDITVAVADWPRRRGQAKYNQRATEHVFGERVPKSKIERATGEYTVLIAEGIYENDMGWKDTVLHEVAHCVAHAKHDVYPKRTRNGTSNGHELASHGPVWKQLAEKIGADPTSCAPRKNEDRKPYKFACPNNCWNVGKVRRSKKIQRPWTRHCKQCGADCVSFDAGDEMPDEEGTCGVSSIKWNDRKSYSKSDRNL